MKDLLQEGRRVQDNFKRFINEAKDTAKSDCLLIPVCLEFLPYLHKRIKKSDVYSDKDTCGLETEPHVTILYGIKPDTFKNQSIQNNIVSFFSSLSPVKIQSCGISIFENEKYDVLKFDITLTNNLLYMRRYAETLPYESEFDGYAPHCTIAYLKKGKGKQYVKDLEGVFDFKCASNTVIYSEADGSKHQIMFGS